MIMDSGFSRYSKKRSRICCNRARRVCRNQEDGDCTSADLLYISLPFHGSKAIDATTKVFKSTLYSTNEMSASRERHGSQISVHGL